MNFTVVWAFLLGAYEMTPFFECKDTTAVNIRRPRKIFSRPGNEVPKICAPVR